MTHTYTHISGATRSNGRPDRSGFSTLEWCTLLIVGIAVVLAASSALTAPAEAPMSPVKVKPGQTLWQLATVHPVEGLTTAQTVELIAERNDLDHGSLRAGATLLVPSGVRGAAVAMR